MQDFRGSKRKGGGGGGSLLPLKGWRERGGGAGTSLPPPAFSFFYSLRPQRSLVQAKDRGPGEEDGEQKDRRRRPSSSCKREMATMVLKGTVVWTEEDARNGRIRFQQSTLSEVRARSCFKRNHQHSIPILKCEPKNRELCLPAESLCLF